jgi:hypothetical protein
MKHILISIEALGEFNINTGKPVVLYLEIDVSALRRIKVDGFQLGRLPMQSIRAMQTI